MTPELVTTIAGEAMIVAIKLAAPLLLVALVLGLMVSIFQAVTQIQEMTLAIIPKMVGVMVVLMIFMPWFLSTSTNFMAKIFNNIPFYIGIK